MKRIIFFLIFFKTYTAHQILEKMSLEEKIAQLFIVGIDNRDYTEDALDINKQTVNKTKKSNQEKYEKLIKEYKIGGIHFCQQGLLQSCHNAINKLQSISEIPLLVTQDFEWGLNMRLSDAIKFPFNMTLGAIQDNNLIYELGREIGRQCKLLGIHINFAPVVDINNNPENPVINYRSFGQDPENVANKAIYFMNGLQDMGIIACAKHFCGHGDTNIDSHLDLPILNKTIKDLNEIELYPFKKVIKAGIKSIMSGHIHVPAIDSQKNRPISLSFNGLTNLLQKQLNFKGLIVTDALDMKGITNYFKPGEMELEAFLAGNDILLMSQNIPNAIQTIKDAILKKPNLEKELNRGILKILKIKNELNISKNNKQFSYNDFHTKYAYELKKKLYESAVKMISNEIIPLSQNPNSKIALILIGSEFTKYEYFNIGLNRHYPNLTKFDINKNEQQRIFESLFDILKDFKTVLVGLFDLNKFSHLNYGITENTLKFLEKVNKEKKLILTIFGNPYSLNLFKNFNNIIMAYEEEKEAQEAAANIIYGKLKPIGKLPIIVD